MDAAQTPFAEREVLTRLDRVILHLRCLRLDHKYRWHLAGVWREVRLTQRKQSILPAAA